MEYLDTQQNILLCVSAAACTLSTVLHILWYLRNSFTVHTSWVLYSSQHPHCTDVWCTKLLLRQPSCFLDSSPLDISNFSFALFLGISGPSGSHVFGEIVKVFANFVECMISLPEKPECFQHLLLDLHLVCSKQLITASSMSLSLLLCQFLLHLFFATFLCCCVCVFFGVSWHQIPIPAHCYIHCTRI